MIVTIRRIGSSDQGTPGDLTFGDFSCKTLELPWRENKPRSSCIPLGEYVCRMSYSPKFRRRTYEVFNVPQRSAIRIHPANFAGDIRLGLKSDLLGCIALGRNFGTDKQLMLLNSRVTVAEFERYLDGKDFILRIE